MVGYLYLYLFGFVPYRGEHKLFLHASELFLLYIPAIPGIKLELELRIYNYGCSWMSCARICEGHPCS